MLTTRISWKCGREEYAGDTSNADPPNVATREQIPRFARNDKSCEPMLYRGITFKISARKSSYKSAPGWYIATFPVGSSSTSVGVVEQP